MFTLPKRAAAGLPLAVTLALLGGCSQSHEKAAPAPTRPVVPSSVPAPVSAPGGGPASASPSPSGAAAVPGRARSAETLIKGLKTAGIACQGWQHLAQTTRTHDAGACYLHEGDGGQQITVATYGTQKQAAAAAKQPTAGPGDVMVVGSKATYVCTSVALCQRIVEKVGGRLVKIPSR